MIEWTASVLAKGNSNLVDETALVQSWSFPTLRLLDEYLSTVHQKPPEEVRGLLRELLFENQTFVFDDATELEDVVGASLGPSSEYLGRLANSKLTDCAAHPGVRWVLDLVDQSPSAAITVINAYQRAHATTLPQGRLDGLSDAMSVINSYYIYREDETWRDVLNRLSPREFEYLTARLFLAMGWGVYITPDGPDGGRDLIVYRANSGERSRFVIECKRYRKVKVGVSHARALLGVVSSEKASGGVLVTTGRCTRGFREFAEKDDRVSFVEGDRLLRLLNRYFGPRWLGNLGALSVPPRPGWNEYRPEWL
ncbi:restriction endonuclease [Tsukamurella pulmonis]|uniref:restriction endonuclease n=1 Tax=Tsukamurella pulmonis TaxID=47312 RepID=UPI0011144047|nr:restriction endonuclease [Tsukamurella pulmonis]